MGASTPQDETKAIKLSFSTIPTGIVSILPEKSKLSLDQYFVKASANSAYSGSFVSTDMINVVLSRGCRFLDFQVFEIKDQKGNSSVVVGVNVDNVITSKNQIPLKDVLKTILINGMNTTAPNPKDPLFLQFRVSPGNSTIYEQMGLLIRNDLANTSFFYNPDERERVSSKTPLSQLMNKIVLVMEIGSSNDYTNEKYYTSPENNLAHFISMESNTSDIPSYTYDMALSNISTPVFVNPYPRNDTTNASRFAIIMPNKSLDSNPEYRNYIQSYGYNVVAYQYYLTDRTNMSLIGEYEAVFGGDDATHTSSELNTSFVSMTNLLKWVASSENK